MPFIQTGIADLVVFEPKVFADDRGFFFEAYNNQVFNDAGITSIFLQDNISKSSYGVVRGLHFQQGDHAQAKLVSVMEGSVLDVAVDLRKGSPTFLKSYSVVLSAENKKALYVPRGFAHGFAVLSETAIFTYKCDNLYEKSSEGGIIYNDPQLNIDWQIPKDDIILSEKDQVLPTIEMLQSSFVYQPS